MRSGGDTKEEAKEEVVEGCRTRKRFQECLFFLQWCFLLLYFPIRTRSWLLCRGRHVAGIKLVGGGNPFGLIEGMAGWMGNAEIKFGGRISIKLSLFAFLTRFALGMVRKKQTLC